MESIIAKLRTAGEYYAAGLLECPDRTPLWRFSHATAEFFRTAKLPPYDGGRLYPCGLSLTNTNYLGAVPEYSYTWRYLAGEIQKKSAGSGTGTECHRRKSSPHRHAPHRRRRRVYPLLHQFPPDSG